MNSKTIIWFRRDLRLQDNPALEHAAKQGQIIPIYILDDDVAGKWKMGGASRWWLHHSLHALSKSLSKIGHHLQVFKGQPQDILKDLIDQTGAKNIVWNRCYEPHAIERDSKIKEHFTNQGVKVDSFNASLLFEPWTIKNQQGNFFKVFTPFWKYCLNQKPSETRDSIKALKKSEPFVFKFKGLKIDDLNLLPQGVNWAKGIEEIWYPGEESALKKFEGFVEDSLDQYKNDRNFMDQPAGTSRLSPHLHFGEISPRHIWHKCQELMFHEKEHTESINCFLSELGWREFSYYLLYHIPELPSEPIKNEFKNFPWDKDSGQLKKWQQGQTGIPIIDAAMRQLWKTGYMHNRARMIAASFLTKNLLIPWQQGAEWFWDTLVDADLANNSMGWQWVAGCGVDAAPYFRIFNPVTQAEKFDPEGEYIKKWVPELKKLPLKYIYQPWDASDEDLKNAEVKLGETYPFPIVDLSSSRRRALDAYQAIKNN
ncbi:MAG: deoxyribodipyrimidine photo-lyase [Candidatus Paracaedibacteraceae bacterium]|nr:deoxyribodipyrimidine photo-lyase [Candidatus Paracaedibacteraceae bacterium]